MQSPRYHTSMKVHIADNHKIVIEGIAAILKNNNIEVEGYSTSGPQVIMWREQHQADVLILDISMPIMNGYDVLKHFKKKGIEQKTLIFSAYNDYHFIDSSLKNGAKGYLLKEDGESLVNALRTICRGGTFFSSKVIQKILDKNFETKNSIQKSETKILLKDLIDNTSVALTSQEERVLRLMSKKYSPTEIQKKMNIKGATYRVYTYKIREKLNIKTTKDLIRYSIATQ